MKAIQLLVNSVLPDELKNYEADFSEKGLNKILYAVATKYPERFAAVLQQISDIGRKVSYQQGETLTLEEAQKYIDEGHFAPGSMLPKVQAAMKFVKANPGKQAIITSLDKAIEALEGKTGTVFTA